MPKRSIPVADTSREKRGITKKERTRTVHKEDSAGKRSKKNQREETLRILQTLPKAQLSVVPFEAGELVIVGSPTGLRWLEFVSIENKGQYNSMATEECSLVECMRDATRQLHEYIEGDRKSFDLLLDNSKGTEFQRRVWKQLCDIPFGQSMSYGEVATKLGKPTAYRAVANACRSNPVGVIVPCHRVVGKNDEMVGFGGGVCMKRWFLEHEGWKPKH